MISCKSKIKSKRRVFALKPKNNVGNLSFCLFLILDLLFGLNKDFPKMKILENYKTLHRLMFFHKPLSTAVVITWNNQMSAKKCLF
jgi:hypothetical protein